ncbi:DNA-binding protein [Fulvivirga sp. RKSG066]|uniref:NADPH-dependent F420 reductase n=1 Tax=Fulvivirga aurantia TaxID=2529383 RepID=UPI0012BC2DB0|nr:NAD(P)-binding domain-containing protein [Fulvivirga aurantia]MTI21610.1 DNA-binding protein [Fulvivirga aurantia]
MSKKIGILGSGIVAKTLSMGFAKHGYEVKLGTRSPEKLADWQREEAQQVNIGTFDEAASFGEIIVLAVKGTAAKSAIDLAKADNLKNKVVIDATNPIADEQPEEGVLKFFTDQNYSLMEELQKEQPHTKFVKAFSSVGSALMVNPNLDSKPTMFIAGNDDEAKQIVSEIIDQFGWETADMGKAQAARAIEPLCMLWCIPGFRDNQWSHAFKLLK